MKFTQAAVLVCLTVQESWARLLSPLNEEMIDEADLRTTPEPFEPIVPTDGGCECESDYDCHPVCDPVYKICVPGRVGPPPTPVPVMTPFPTAEDTPCPCDFPKTIPTECEVEILIAMMDLVVSGDHKRAAQWLRASFHDAGTCDHTIPEGGANGCLMNHPPMLAEPENAHLLTPVMVLQSIKNNWEIHPDTCITISSADILQFAGMFATVRQRGPTPGVLDAAKIAQLLTFEWGRIDEPLCDPAWTHNLPGFQTPFSGGPIAGRCMGAGIEIKEKMMDRNGFTASEATVLIGAHTIGLVRNTFGPGFAGPWVANGADTATLDGPVFDNAFHHFIINTVTANDAVAFGSAPLPSAFPFDQIFPDWFRDGVNNLDHLDTDVALAFPSQDLAQYPDFRPHSQFFAANNADFLSSFDQAYDKMSKLCVTDPLSPPAPCEPCEEGAGGIVFVPEILVPLIREIGNITAYGEKELAEELEMMEPPIEMNPIEIPTEFDPTMNIDATMEMDPIIDTHMEFEQNFNAAAGEDTTTTRTSSTMEEPTTKTGDFQEDLRPTEDEFNQLKDKVNELETEVHDLESKLTGEDTGSK